jgi:hypothetical protein
VNNKIEMLKIWAIHTFLNYFFVISISKISIGGQYKKAPIKREKSHSWLAQRQQHHMRET